MKHPKATIAAIVLAILASIFILAVALPANADAAEAPLPPWLDVVHSADATKQFSFKRGSCDLSGDMIGCVERTVNTTKQTTLYTIVGVAKSACTAGWGELITVTMGGALVSRDGVVKGGDTIAALEFDTLCIILATNAQPSKADATL